MNFLSRRPAVTVILASYNHAPFVGSAVASVLAQSLDDLELIVVDDGSSDATPDIVAAIRDPRLRLVRMKLNRAVHPRNHALGLARGRYVAFQNSDDEWLPEKLALQVAALEHDRTLSASFTAAALIDAAGAPLTGSWAEGLFTTLNRRPSAWLRQFFDIGNCLPLPSVLVRREQVAALGGFRASLIQLADFDLWIQLAALGGFRVLPQALTRVRIVGDANLSAPKPAGLRRSQLELPVVLGRYLAPPLLAMFKLIFPDLPDPGTEGGRKVALALRALGHGSAGAAFADRAIEGVLEDPRQREEAVAAHGAGFIHGFIARRGAWAFLPQDGAG